MQLLLNVFPSSDLPWTYCIFAESNILEGNLEGLKCALDCIESQVGSPMLFHFLKQS